MRTTMKFLAPDSGKMPWQVTAGREGCPRRDPARGRTHLRHSGWGRSARLGPLMRLGRWLALVAPRRCIKPKPFGKGQPGLALLLLVSLWLSHAPILVAQELSVTPRPPGWDLLND